MAIDLASWLQQLGLAQYEPAFRDNEVDGDVLPDLTAEDLIAIGVTPVGHRRKLLSAIAALGAAAPAPALIATPVSGPPPAPAPAQAERRQLTVMFCDLVGSTALSTGMDPEDLRDVITSFQNRCSAAIRRYDGFVAKYMGDGILFYFGYPRAHEDEAERSVRAGIARPAPGRSRPAAQAYAKGARPPEGALHPADFGPEVVARAASPLRALMPLSRHWPSGRNRDTGG